MTHSSKPFIKIYCTAEEKQLFEQQADAQHLSCSRYAKRALMALGTATPPYNSAQVYLRLGELYVLLSLLESDLAQLSGSNPVPSVDVPRLEPSQDGTLLLPGLSETLETLQGELQRLSETLHPPA